MKVCNYRFIQYDRRELSYAFLHLLFHD